jgi:hypothetical protein
MSERRKDRGPPVEFAIFLVILGILALVAIPNCVRSPWTSPATACINNLREIDGAKEEWTLKHNAKTNDIVTFDQIKPYLVPDDQPNAFIKLDAKGNLPKCPEGGIYTIGRIGEPPTCSLGTTVNPQHVLP